MALVAAMSALLLRDFGWKGVPVFSLICFVLIISFAEPYLREIGEGLLFLGEEYDVSDEARAVLKVVGVGYLCGIVSDSCQELGEGRIASAVTFIGRIEIIAIIIPFFEEIIRLGVELVG